MAVVHNPEMLLKISTTSYTSEPPSPPPNKARFETDVAASSRRATLRVYLEKTTTGVAAVA
jgi:hypothetical protein